ncbi:MAG: hypothetical protein PHT48_11170 [Dechloromonas sp.]|nr:hypothetical protein [Dechloromonas sp.]
MTRSNHRLRREIYAIVIIKLLIIMGLWWAFVRDAQVDVDGDRFAEHLSRPSTSIPPLHQPGEPHAQ